MSTRRMGYRETLRWLLDNDDTTWLEDEEHGIISVTTCLVADIFGIDQDKVTRDLKRLKERY